MSPLIEDLDRLIRDLPAMPVVAQRVMHMLDRVGLPDAGRQFRAYAHQLSGGMRQRVMIAMAMACEPRLLIADEPTTALDVTIQAEILALMDRLKSETGTAVLFSVEGGVYSVVPP